MDNNAFVVTSSRAPADFLARCLVVDQLYQGSESDIRWNSLTSIPSSRVVAVVDRTGDLELAAKEIVASRLAFGSKSRFAVDQIMVNEFVANKFTDVVVKALAVFQARSSDKLTINGPTSRSRRAKKSEHDDARVVAEAVKRNTCSVLAAEEVATLVEVSQR